MDLTYACCKHMQTFRNYNYSPSIRIWNRSQQMRFPVANEKE